MTTPANPDDLRCWRCGVEPLGMVEDTCLGQPEPSYISTHWPVGDHTHEVTAPTPGELATRGDRSLARIMEIWAE